MSVSWYWPDWPNLDPDTGQSLTACCPRDTIPDGCNCPDGCACLCGDCDCRLPDEGGRLVPRDLNRHQCPIGRCDVLIARSKLLCLDHWRMLPAALRDAVTDAYAFGAGVGTVALRDAQIAAIDFIKAKLAAKGGTS